MRWLGLVQFTRTPEVIGRDQPDRRGPVTTSGTRSQNGWRVPLLSLGGRAGQMPSCTAFNSTRRWDDEKRGSGESNPPRPQLLHVVSWVGRVQAGAARHSVCTSNTNKRAPRVPLGGAAM